MNQTRILIGGGRHNTKELDTVNAAIAPILQGKERMLVIPFATDSHKVEKWFEQVKNHYSLLGVKEFEIIEEESVERMKQQIDSADILFLTGGRPDRLIDKIHDLKLLPAFQSFNGIIIGYSAGALALCKWCLITEDDDYPETFMRMGLGLFPEMVEVHYKPEIDSELIPIAKIQPIYAIPDGSALIVKGASIQVVNNVVLFDLRKRKKGDRNRCCHSTPND